MLHNDLIAVLDYAQPDEERDYVECVIDGNDQEGHIVLTMRRLRETRFDLLPTPDDLIDAAENLRSRVGHDSTDIAYDIQHACHLLEQVAAAITDDEAQRDILLEGRTDLGMPTSTNRPTNPRHTANKED
jgi:hypothetical protein